MKVIFDEEITTESAVVPEHVKRFALFGQFFCGGVTFNYEYNCLLL